MLFSRTRSFAAIAGGLLFLGAACTNSHAQLSKPTALLKGEVRSEEDQSVVAGLQVAVMKGSDRVASSKTNVDGKFTAIVPPGGQYRISYTSKDYAFREDTINVPSADKYQEIAVRTTVMPLRDNQDFTPKQPVFVHGSSTIDHVAAERLDQLATLVRKNGRVRLQVAVYPDMEITSKKDAPQQRLLDQRATALRSFFLSRNVSSANISVEALPTLSGTDATASVMEAPAKGKKKKPAVSHARKAASIAQVVKITGHLS